MKFALVSFTKTDSISIVETNTIATDRDRTSMNNDDWRASVEVQVTWTERSGKKGQTQQHQSAKKLRFSGEFIHQTILLQQLHGFISPSTLHWSLTVFITDIACICTSISACDTIYAYQATYSHPASHLSIYLSKEWIIQKQLKLVQQLSEKVFKLVVRMPNFTHWLSFARRSKCDKVPNDLIKFFPTFPGQEKPIFNIAQAMREHCTNK